MKNKSTETSLSFEETAYEMSLRMVGYDLSEDAIKIAYRLALLVNEKKENVSIKDIVIIQGKVIEEVKKSKE
jgi:hypothetical protein